MGNVVLANCIAKHSYTSSYTKISKYLCFFKETGELIKNRQLAPLFCQWLSLPFCFFFCLFVFFLVCHIHHHKLTREMVQTSRSRTSSDSIQRTLDHICD